MLAELGRVKVIDPFFDTWTKHLVEQGVPHQWRMCEETGRLENFRRAARAESGTVVGRTYNDSDVYKVAEAAAYGYQLNGDPGLRAILDEFASLVTGAQCPDGYIHTAIQVNHPESRYLSLCSRHEMYCMGHLLEACCAYESALDDGRMKQVAIKIGDHLQATFGPGKRKGYCGHQEVEIGLAKAGRMFGRPGFIDLAKWMTDQRGTRPSPFEAEMADPAAREFSGGYQGLVEKDGEYVGGYFQDDMPLREQTQAVGHSVRAMYQFIGALETMAPGDDQLLATLETIWENMVARRTYLTGGIGSSGRNEGFTRDYDLPNETAYAETCAGVGLCMWSARMAVLTRKSSFAKAFQRTLYNNVLAGVSLDTTSYHYDNPLESTGGHRRTPWFDCACCPPNVARFLLGLGQYAVGVDSGEVTLVLPVSMDAAVDVGPHRLGIKVRSEYPWRSACRVTLTPDSTMKVVFRVPGTLAEPEAKPAGLIEEDGWVVFSAVTGDETSFEVDLGVATQVVASHPEVLHNSGRVAVVRGPLVYCAEERDNSGPAQRLALDPASLFATVETEDVRERLFLKTQGWRDDAVAGQLYPPADSVETVETDIVLRPYFSWNNGEPGTMQVWLRSRQDA